MPSETPLAAAAPGELREAVRDRYGALARDPSFDADFPVGRAHALALGYPQDLLDQLPASIVAVFAGPGAPVLSAEIQPRERVLDLGCGAGMDAAIAAGLTGPGGTVVGLDSAVDMVRVGRQGLNPGMKHVALTAGEATHLPFQDGAFDVVVANGLLNLELGRDGVVSEIARVLRPQGRLVGAEVILVDDVDRSAFTVSDWFR